MYKHASLLEGKVGRGQRSESEASCTLNFLYVFLTFDLDLVEYIIMSMNGVLRTKKVQNQSNKDTVLYYLFTHQIAKQFEQACIEYIV